MPPQTEIYQAAHYGWQSLLTGQLKTQFPSELNTGWEPTGTTLTPWTGGHFFDGETIVMEDKLYTEEIMIIVRGANVTLRRCEIRCAVDASQGSQLYMEDCTVKAGNISNPAIGYGQMEIVRCNVQGGQHSVKGDSDTIVRESLLWKQYNDPASLDSTGYHNNGFISNGGGNIQVLRNTVEAATVLTPNGGGPTGNISLLPDFDICHDVLIDGNLLLPTTGGFGFTLGYAPQKEPYGDFPHHIVCSNNWLMRGPNGHNGAFGDYTSFKLGEPTNHFTNNRFLDNNQLIVAV